MRECAPQQSGPRKIEALRNANSSVLGSAPFTAIETGESMLRDAKKFAFVFALFTSTASFAAAVPREIIPSSAPHGARVILVGTGLDAPSLAIAFSNGSGGTVAAPIVARAATFVEAAIPATAASGNVAVSAGGATVGTFPFTLLPDPPFVKTATILASQKSHDTFNQPAGAAVAVANGITYVADTQHHQIKRVSADGKLLSVIGSGNPGLADGPASQAQFKQPQGIAIDPVSQLIYVADTGNNVIRRLMLDGVVSTFAGSGHDGSADGIGVQATFKQPMGLAVDVSGNLCVADAGNNEIRLVSSAGAVTTLAGSVHAGFADGPVAQALFNQPSGVAVDSNGIVYVADSGNNRIRKIGAGAVTTIAGTGHGALVDGSALVAEFKQPSGIALDDAGNLLVGDSANNAIRKISMTAASATISTIAGNGSPGYVDGVPGTSRFNQPFGVDRHGALSIADSMNDALRAIYPAIRASAVYPRRGPISGGNTIRVFGTGFVPGATQVTFGGVAATALTFVTSTELLATLPSGVASSVDVKVTTAAGTDTLAGAYTYLPPPTMATIQPNKGKVAGGETVTITGTNFVDGGDTTVTIGGASAANVVVNSPMSLTLVTPPGVAGTADVIVTTPGATTIRTGGFAYFAPPVITSFSPVQGGAGTAVTIIGQNFDADATGDQVSFGAVNATITSAAATQLVVTVPNGASTGKISVITAGGSAQSATDFVVATFTSLRITSPSTTLDVGTSIQFNAIGVLITGGGADVTAKTLWTSNNASVGVTSTGIVTAVAAGSADVTASFDHFTATVHVIANAIAVPPDPATLAPTLDPTVVSQFGDEIRFLYTGPNASQTGVAPNVIDDSRASLLRGTTRASSGIPLPGVRVTALGHAEYGQTLSRTDGTFDFAINGGGTVTLRFDKPGYIGAQRSATSQWNEQTALPDVILVGYDSQVTAISAGASEAQVVRSTAQSDGSGARQTTLIVPSGTNAVLTYPDGTTRSASTLNIRATEFTVGQNGPKAMPAPLPATSAYTYCVELSADEAATTGASAVQFSKPIPFYVENFLNFPTGTVVPVGYYDRQRGAWISSDNGIVLKILAISNGSATVDTNGDGVADGAATLATLGIDAAELQKLGALYPAGQSLWRIPVTHFSPMDGNWPAVPPADAVAPNQPRPDPVNSSPTQHDVCGPRSQVDGNSTVNCYSQTLMESIPIVGTAYRLEYDSSRALQPPYRMTVHLSGATLPSSLRQIELTIGIAGRSSQLTFAPQTNLSYEFSWDGTDAYSRPVQGTRDASVSIAYLYPANYGTTTDVSATTWARALSLPITAGPTRDNIRLTQAFAVPLGHDRIDDSFGGWSLSAQRFFDGRGRVIYDSAGQQRAGDPENTKELALTMVAGNTQCCFGGDAGPATQAVLDYPEYIAVGPDGALYIADTQVSGGYSRIRRVDPKTGLIATVAGNGTSGFAPDGALAAGNPILTFKIAAGPDGSLYLVDHSNNRVRRIVDGIVTTVAGTGVQDFNQNVVNGTLAIQTPINPVGLAVGPDGSVYIGERLRLSRVGPDGIFTTVYGGRNSGSTIDVNGVAVGPDGSVYASSTDQKIHKITPGGQHTVIAGGSGPLLQDGAPATSGSLCNPWGLAVAPDGTILVAESGNCPHVRAIGPNGIVTTVAGTGTFPNTALPPNGLPARSTPIGYVKDVQIAPDGSVYFTDSWVNIIRRADDAFPAARAGSTIIPSSDGSEAYVFEGGRHTRTVDTLTGTTILTLGYDAHGFLISLTDADGNVSTIQRDASGAPAAIIAPGGQQTTLTATGGKLTSIRNPAGEGFDFSYNSAGLLAQMTDPRKGTHSYSYDQNGLLTRDEGPDGSFFAFSRSGLGQSYTVTRTTAEGRVHSYRAQLAGNTSAQREYTAPDGTRSLAVFAGALQTTTFADGSSVAVSSSADPRFGMQAPLASLTVSGGGKTLSVNRSRATTLSDPLNPLTLTSMTDRVTINGNVWTSVYTAATRNIFATSPNGRTATLQLDSKGRLASAQQPGIAQITFGLDTFGWLSTLQQGSRNSSFAYNGRHELTGVTDPLGRAVHFTYDDAGRVTTQTLPDGRVIAFTYDAAGNLTALTPPGRPSHFFSYTPGDVTSSYTPPAVPGGGVTLYVYDKDRQLTLITRPDGRSISLGYDISGRLSNISIARGAYGFAYNSAGQISAITAPDAGQLTYAYSGPLLTSASWAGMVAGSVGFGYDNNFRLSTESAGGSSVTFTYDRDGLLTAAGALTLTRDAQNGLMTGTTLGSISDTWTYNNFGEPVGYTATASGTPLFSQQYMRDDGGRITQKSETIAGQNHTYSYGYDSAGRLSAAARDGSTTSYTYDSNSNRLPGTYDDQDRLLTYAGTAYTFTGNGELATKTDLSGTTTYTYDELGNLIHVALPNGEMIDYVIDGKNRRVGKKINGILVRQWLYGDALRTVAELDGTGGVISRYVYGSRANAPDYIVRGGTTYRIISDHLGSPRLIVDSATGAIAQRIDYDEFGNVLSDSNPGFQTFGFAGGVYDPDTNLVRFGARDYDAGTGRWTTKDPPLFGGGDANLYGYAFNDPVNFIDREGNEAVTATVAVGAAAGPAAGAAVVVAGSAIAVGTASYIGVELINDLVKTSEAEERLRETIELNYESRRLRRRGPSCEYNPGRRMPRASPPSSPTPGGPDDPKQPKPPTLLPNEKVKEVIDRIAHFLYEVFGG